MSWSDEILEAAYNAPSGKRQTFMYENVSRETDLKTASFIFPELDGALVQSLGVGGRTFALSCIFSGADCLKLADGFEALLCERGAGLLEHPVYGRINVVPTGKIKRIDNLKDGLNESTVEVTFSETLIEKGDTVSNIVTSDSLDDTMNAFEEAAAADFADKVQIDSIEDKMNFQAILDSQTDSIIKGVEKMVNLDEKTKKDNLKWLKQAKNFIGSTRKKINSVELKANEIARTVIKTARLPSKIVIGALAKIEGYSSIIKDITTNIKTDPVGIKAIKNQYAATSLAISSLTASLGFGVAASAQQGEFKNRADAMEAKERASEIFDEYSAYVDRESKKNAFVETGEVYSEILNVMTESQKAVEQEALNLPMMRTITLDRDRQLFELLTELYGEDGFNRQDEFIIDNKLTADEIVLLPMGREVCYYA